MTQENKKLLLVDLCARLPYYTEFYSNVADGNWAILTPVVISNLMSATDKLVIKPYLRPMSSMTEKEREQLYFAIDFYGKIDKDGDIDASHHDFVFSETCMDYIDWLNAHHFDYRGLIGKGLALEMTKSQ